jgi:hypothetical protein
MMSGCLFWPKFYTSEFLCDLHKIRARSEFFQLLHKIGVICRRYHARSPMISPMANTSVRWIELSHGTPQL